ncbi:hypothetical protein QSJ18_06940 [Gordonia sp. ABSL1-1]|uniref:hypothetical protein n=1 Tax=Gordonia sp. ABSL1-1 TaxID=3053923 RepID=UPI002573427E|nr:hypothetical protein [Gordonia sp. ABSL1-1]MDL9936473.1 hypothetical protein [Gordonia sp. ABSL1-1]
MTDELGEATVVGTPPASGADRALAPGWARLLLVVVGIPQVVTGLWAVSAPQHFFDHFPGLGPMLVAAEPPFNHHLVSDTGSGFLATGVLVLIAAIWGLRPLVFVASICLIVFAVPHSVFHALHPADALTAAENVVNVAVLVVGAAIPVVVAYAARPEFGHNPSKGQ